MQTMNTQQFKQGDIWYWKPKDEKAKHGIIYGARPVIIISNDIYNQFSYVLNVIPLSSKARNNPAHVEIYLHKISQALCEQLKTVSKKELKDYWGYITQKELRKIQEALIMQFNINTGGGKIDG